MTQSQSVHLALVWGGRRGAGKRVKLCQKFLELFFVLLPHKGNLLKW